MKPIVLRGIGRFEGHKSTFETEHIFQQLTLDRNGNLVIDR